MSINKQIKNAVLFLHCLELGLLVGVLFLELSQFSSCRWVAYSSQNSTPLFIWTAPRLLWRSRRLPNVILETMRAFQSLFLCNKMNHMLGWICVVQGEESGNMKWRSPGPDRPCMEKSVSSLQSVTNNNSRQPVDCLSRQEDRMGLIAAIRPAVTSFHFMVTVSI